MENLKIKKDYSYHSNSYGKDLQKEICIKFSRQMDSNHSPGYHTRINTELGWDYFIPLGYPIEEGAKRTSVLYVLISIGCDVF